MSEPFHIVSSVIEHTRLTNGFPTGFVYALGNWFVSVLPTNSTPLYRFCRKVVDRYNGDNNGDMATNGKLHLMRRALRHATVVFDVGANVGDWTSEALGAVFGVPTELGSTADRNIVHDFLMGRRHRMRRTVRVSIQAENVRHFPPRGALSPRPYPL